MIPVITNDNVNDSINLLTRKNNIINIFDLNLISLIIKNTLSNFNF